MRKRRINLSSTSRRRFSPLALVGVAVSLAIVLVGTAIFVIPRMLTHAAQAGPNQNCTLIVPPNPLTAQGLATPYQLTATDAAQGPCNEANSAQAVFAQGAVINPATGQISIYNPLVIDKGTQPAAAPVVPTLPAGGIVGIWFGGNDSVTTLQGTNGSLRQGNCVNGVNGSPFGQVAFCNAAAFFRAANTAIAAGKLNVPALGMAKDGQPCPTVRDFSVVDQDQSDNVTADYLVTASGQTAQMTAANKAALPDATSAGNGSDNRLVDRFIDPALGCTPWAAPDLADPGQMVTAQPLNELMAAARQAKPVALVPAADPMVLNNNNRDLRKLNLYRQGVDQPVVQDLGQASGRAYCNSLVSTGVARLKLDMQLTTAAPSVDTGVGNSLFTFLAARFTGTYTMLNCQKSLGKADPVTVTTDANGVATSATITTPSGGNTTPPDCVINGTVVTGCNGTATMNGASCTLAMDQTTNQVQITCPPAGGPVPKQTPPPQ